MCILLTHLCFWSTVFAAVFVIIAICAKTVPDGVMKLSDIQAMTLGSCH